MALPPWPLRSGVFVSVALPESEDTLLSDLGGSPYDLIIAGSGEDATGTLIDQGNQKWALWLDNGGRGFVQEPTVQVLDGNKTVVLTLNPSWIQSAHGLDHNETTTLLDKGNLARWLRGIRVASPSAVSAKRKSLITDLELNDYYVSYRSDVSTSGVTLSMASNVKEGPLEVFMLDATPQTPQNFNDAALLIGSTFSDYDADIHITPSFQGRERPYALHRSGCKLRDSSVR